MHNTMPWTERIGKEPIGIEGELFLPARSIQTKQMDKKKEEERLR
jgi:hypothetical protein